MANIKVSEMNEATSFDDGDYTMIVQANQSKKISKENMIGNIESNISTINTNIGNLSNLETDDKTSIVNSINELKNAEIYSTEETKTNEILPNNKPVYKKAFSFTQWSGLGVDIGIEDVEYIVDSGVSLKNTETSQWRNLSYDTDGINGYFIKKSGNTYKFLIQNNGVYTADSVFAWVKYSKTS